MNVIRVNDLNKKVREILKGLDVKWKDGGQCLSVSSKIIHICLNEIENDRDKNKYLLLEIKELIDSNI